MQTVRPRNQGNTLGGKYTMPVNGIYIEGRLAGKPIPRERLRK